MKYWLNENKELIFHDEYRFANEYTNGRSLSLIGVGDDALRSFYRTVSGRKPENHFLIIQCQIGGRTIPMIDCDSQEDFELTINYLKKKLLGYAVFKSSEGHAWVFPGFSFSTYKGAHAAVDNVPGGDPRYQRMALKARMYVIRGECKKRSQSAPELVECTTTEPSVLLFVNLLQKHFTSKCYQDIIKKRESYTFSTLKCSSSRVSSSYLSSSWDY
jgi:hypothetical protein